MAPEQSVDDAGEAVDGPSGPGADGSDAADDLSEGQGTPTDGQFVVLFDGVCNLCSGFVQFLIPRDPERTFAFASLQSDVATELLEDRPVDADALESIVLVEGEDVYVKSSAVLRIAYHLGGVYRLLWPTRVFPRRFRDWWYDFVANRRYRWFGKKDRCMIPDEDVSDRFLDDG